MKRRSGGSSERGKSRGRKATALKRGNAPKATRQRGISIAGQEKVVARLTRERDEALLREAANSEILRLISKSSGDLELVFRSILENATRLCEAQFGFLFGYDGKLFNNLAVRNVPAVLLEFMEQRGAFLPPAGTVLHDLLVTRDVVHRADASGLQTQSAPVRLAGAKSFVAVPMFKDEALVGAISIYRQEVRPFTEKQIELLQNFAAQAVIAIENTRLLNELRQRTTDLGEALEQQTASADVLRIISSSPGDLEPVFQAMSEKAVSICDAKFGTLFRFDGSAFHLAAQVNTPAALAEFQKQRGPFLPPSGSNLDRVMKTKQVRHTADDAAETVPGAAARLGGARSVVHVPMLKDDELAGALVIYRTEVRPFTAKQIELVENFAAQAVIAIETSRLLNELRESLDRQTATADILRVIAGTPEDSKRALDTIAETASRMFGVANVNFRRIEGDVLRIVSSAGPTVERLRKALPDIPLEPTDPAVRCFLDNRQIPIEDRRAVLANEHGAIATVLRELPVRSQVFTPLSRQGKAIGVMIVTRGEVQPFQQGDLDLMKGFADQAVIAIENARLLSELRESYRLVQQQAGKLEVQSQELVKLNQQLEQRVTDQVGEIERMGRLRRFLPPQVADLIVASGTEKQLESHRREITALFCDLRGFTGFSESSDPEDVMALLRDYHAAIGQIIIKYSGTLERFAGDGVMVVFNDPVPVENPALQAVLMALEMRVAIGALIEKWRRLGHDLGFGIGIAHGFATLGTIGFEGRFDYAAIGTVSNVASRLCDEAKPGQILISPRVLMAVEEAVTVEPVGEFTLKGISRPLSAHNVLGATPKNPN
jgi:class 3 adenylate cyclase/putative methionine-R-sulfoxide reductase with GAF domain